LAIFRRLAVVVLGVAFTFRDGVTGFLLAVAFFAFSNF
jgi:hypothetical protein